MKYLVMMSAALVSLTGCQKAEVAVPAPQKLSESDAQMMVNRNEVEFRSADAARIKAAYTPDVVAFDPGVPELMTDRAAFDKAQDAFAAQKYDGLTNKERKIQVVDADTIIVSGTAELSSSTVPANYALMRYTQVYGKQGDGKWLIVNEHLSAAPKK